MRTSRLSVAALCLLAAGARAEEASVVHLPAAVVTEAFAKGSPLIEVDAYKVHASRREGPGMAEVHELDTDILYVLHGEAVLITGGEVVDPRETAPHEIRGASILEGRSQLLEPGDVMIVPHGTPHWFQEASNPFTYYVVKVTERGGSP